jgi:hypothetical protein
LFSVSLFILFTASCYSVKADESPLENFRGTPSSLPIRVPRSFFQEQNLIGKLTAKTVTAGLDLQVDSSIQWTEEETQQAPPRSNALADFRDHPGCAYYKTADGVAVCFNMMGDVYSLGVNAKDTQVRGLANYINEQLAKQASSSCHPEIQNLQFNQAKRTDDQLIISFSGNLIAEPECAAQAENVAVQFELKSV